MRTCPHCQQRYSDSETFCSRDGAGLSEPDGTVTDPLLGQRVEGYLIEERLGEGGMGIVYHAARSPDQKAALKVLRSEYTQNQDILARFHQEAMAVNQIRHKNIVDILSLGVLERGSPYILMEHLEGKDLGAVLDGEGRLAAERATRIITEVAEALLAAHEAGVIHRDLKPENIFLVSPEEEVKVLDFGIAKLTRKPGAHPKEGARESARTHTGVIMGTPHYMSPEQASGKPAIFQTDIYALGVIFYEMLTGHVPFRSPDGPLHILMQHINEEPTPPTALTPDIPPTLERVILCCLSKDWQKRYGSMRALLDDLTLIKEGKEPAFAPPRAAPTKRLLPSRASSSLGMIASLLFVLLLGGFLYASGLLSAQKPGPPYKETPPRAPLSAQTQGAASLPYESVLASLPTSMTATTLSQTVTVLLTTEPSGAQIVMEGNAQELKTPTRLVLPKQDREVLFSFRLEGYQEEEKLISLAKDAEIFLKLTAPAGRPPWKKTPRDPPPAGDDPDTPPVGEDPVKTPPPDQLDPYDDEKKEKGIRERGEG